MSDLAVLIAKAHPQIHCLRQVLDGHHYAVHRLMEAAKRRHIQLIEVGQQSGGVFVRGCDFDIDVHHDFPLTQATAACSLQ